MKLIIPARYTPKSKYSFIFDKISHLPTEKMGVADYTATDFENFCGFVIRTIFYIKKIGTHKNLKISLK